MKRFVIASLALGATALAAPPPTGPQETQPPMPAAIVKLGDGSYVGAVEGQTRDVRFVLGGQFRVAGKGFGGTVNAWILGNRGGGSMLDIVSQTDTELVLRVTEIAADEKPWAAGAQGSADSFITLKIAAARGERIFRANLPGAWYACSKGEPNCG